MSKPTINPITGRFDMVSTASDFADNFVAVTGDTMTGGLTITPTANSLTTLSINTQGGTNVLTVDTTNQRVGIGTATPSHPLHVASSTGMRIGSGTKYYDFYTSGLINDLNSSDDISINFSNGKHLCLGAGGTSRLGINTLAPSLPLHVNNSAGGRFGTDAKYIDIFTYGGGNDINSSDDLYINFNNNKHVLIGYGGTSNLTMTGSCNIGGALNHDGTTVGFYGATPVAVTTGWAVSNVTEDKVFDANSTTIDELADVLGTVITRLISLGLISA